jgi:hypothetical protein
VTADGRHAYVTNFIGTGTVSQYDIDPLSSALSPMTPASVATTGGLPEGIAVTPGPRVPTSKEQCKHGGWRDVPQFKKQGPCVRFVNNGK